MAKTALITGASSGIGFELSKLFSSSGYNLVLVSENRQELEEAVQEIESQDDIQIKAVVKDLSKPSAAQELYDDIVADGKDIDVLVNNAGFGIGGEFTEITPAKHMDLIQLNIVALTQLCNLFCADMVKRRSGSILNVASTAAFQAGPCLSTYFASKAYVLSLSEALHSELERYGVNVTALCPGPTQTNFIARADISETRLANVPWIMNAAEVAKAGFVGLMKGKKIIIPGFMNKFLVFIVRFLPRSLVTSVTGYLNRK